MARYRNLRRRVGILFTCIAAIWAVALLDAAIFGGSLPALGITPRTQHGLVGIVAAPFLHGDLQHLLANTAGILIFGGLVIVRGERPFWSVTVVGALVSGLGMWAFGRPGIHIGASGIVFAYFGYLLVTGFFERRFGALLLSIAVFLIWGPTLYGVVPVEGASSWEGHLFGFIGGILTAWVLAGRPLRGGI